ncbi:MAG: BatA domain-containing protein [Planctomycetota bacterium]
MTFLNASVLLGLLAAVIPVVLHLLARQKPRRVILPTARFLQTRSTSQTSRLRVRRWWLLAMRVLAILAIAAVLARPMISSASSVTWSSIAGLFLTAMALMAVASLGWLRGVGKWLVGIVAAIAALILLVSIGWSIQVVAASESIDTGSSQPVAIALVIDNSPTSARRDEVTPNTTRLQLMIRAAQEMLGRVPAGSDVCIVDRHAIPLAFSMDIPSARQRLSQLSVFTVPAPMAQRVEAAAAQLRTSSLDSRQIVIFSDLSTPSWESSRNRLSGVADSLVKQSDDDPGIRVGVMDTLSAWDTSPTQNDVSRMNRILSPPSLVEATATSGTPVPIVVRLSLTDAIADQPINVTVQLSLLSSDPSLPVLRNGEVIRPPARQVDRVSTSIAQGDEAELTLTLPPLNVGTAHAVIDLIGPDTMPLDDRRFLTVDIPRSPSVLIVGDDRSPSGDQTEMDILAKVLCAPHAMNDPSCSYRIDRVQTADMTAIDLERFDALLWIDPPFRVSKSSAGTDVRLGWSSETGSGLTRKLLENIGSFVDRGGGIAWLLGPSLQIADEVDVPIATTALLPPMNRRWKFPEPGSFLSVQAKMHPMFRGFQLLQEDPRWSEFLIRRHWRVERPDADPAPDVLPKWNVLASMAGTDAPAILAATDPAKRMIVWTTPLPALSDATRSWNDLFSQSDAWPAFTAVRGMTAWLTGLTDGQQTILAGDVPRVIVPSNAMIQLFPPGDGQPERLTDRVDSAEVAQGLPDESLLPMPAVSKIGTYFVKGDGVQTGFSSNLPMRWSSNQRTHPSEIREWLGTADWQWVTDADEVSLGGGSSSTASISMHGPLMIVALAAFVLEQVISHWFYRGPREVPAL